MGIPENCLEELLMAPYTSEPGGNKTLWSTDLLTRDSSSRPKSTITSYLLTRTCTQYIGINYQDGPSASGSLESWIADPQQTRLGAHSSRRSTIYFFRPWMKLRSPLEPT